MMHRVLEMAFGGKTASEMFDGERKFPIRLRYSQEYRKDENDIAALMVPTQDGAKIPLKKSARLKKTTELHLFTEMILKDTSGLNFPSATVIWEVRLPMRRKRLLKLIFRTDIL
jgi:cobalt-zinc-cadmium resistance protein CzcA